MFGDYFYHELTRKYIAYFGTLFNDITINRTDRSSNVIQSLKVPVMYSPRSKYLARLLQEPEELKTMIATQLPAISFEIIGFSYDAQRKTQTLLRTVEVDNSSNNSVKAVYSPVPYNIDFSLSIYSANMEDHLRIMDQILPYFKPDWTSTLMLIPELNIKMDIPVIFNGTVVLEEAFEGSLETPRILVYTLPFTLKGYYYGPYKDAKVIKKAIVNFHNTPLTKHAIITANTNQGLFTINERAYQYNDSGNTAFGLIYNIYGDKLYIKNIEGEFNANLNIHGEYTQSIGEILNIDRRTYTGERVTVQPAMTIDGKPTSNVSDSIDYTLINIDDNYGIATTITEF